MNPIINQLAAIIDPEGKDILAAEKLVLLSGLSRGGFFRDCALIPDELLPGKHRKNGVVWFVNTAEGEALPDDVRKSAVDELNAFGVSCFFSEDEDGSAVLKLNREGSKEQKLTLRIVSCPGSACPRTRSYSASPVPFEMLTLTELAAGSDVMSALNALTAQDSKTKKAPKKSASKDENPAGWVQPSLFDF